MFRSYNSEESKNLRPQEHLQNLSFFQMGKTYDFLPKRNQKSHSFEQFSSWSQKDQQNLINLRFNFSSFQNNHKKSADPISKKVYQDTRLRYSNSVTFHTKKIDLGSRTSQLFMEKYSSKIKSKTVYSQNVSRDFNKQQFQQMNSVQNKNKGLKLPRKSKKELDFINKTKTGENPQILNDQQTKISYNIINYPITTTTMRRRNFKKMQRFPFPSLAMRLNK